MTTLAFDSTALSHFARAGRLADLEIITADDERVVPAEVLAELARVAWSSVWCSTFLSWGYLGMSDRCANHPGGAASCYLERLTCFGGRPQPGWSGV